MFHKRHKAVHSTDKSSSGLIACSFYILFYICNLQHVADLGSDIHTVQQDVKDLQQFKAATTEDLKQVHDKLTSLEVSIPFVF